MREGAQGAIVLSEAPGVVTQYAAVWVLVQDGRRYSENLTAITRLRASRRAEAEIRVGGITAVQVFHLRTPRSSLHARR